MVNRTYLLITIFMIIMVIPFVLTASIKADYKIIEGNILVEINFESVENLELIIPYDAKAVELNINDYVIEDRQNYKKIKVSSAENLEIKYITKTYLDVSGDNYFFILKNQFENESDITLYLPESAVLDESILIFPEPDIKTTDGRRIILGWNNYNEEQILVSYEFLETSKLIYYIIIVILIIFLIILYMFQKRKFKKELKGIKEKGRKKGTKIKKEEDLTKNLFEDEKKIVKYLLNKKNNECWTKEIIRDLDISKVKLSRKLRSLEQKEVIKRIPYGNENRIRLLKK